LLGDVGGRARAARRVEDEVTRVGGHQEATFDRPCCRLDDIDLWIPEAALASVIPDVVPRFEREVVEISEIGQG